MDVKLSQDYQRSIHSQNSIN